MNNKILLVDDDASVSTTVEFILDRAHLDVAFQSVTNGVDCLQVLRNGFRGLIFMDVMMPEMDGWETIAAIVEKGLLEGNVICMLTAVGDPGSIMDGLAEYVLDYVRKPFEAEELLSAVEEGLVMCGKDSEE